MIRATYSAAGLFATAFANRPRVSIAAGRLITSAASIGTLHTGSDLSQVQNLEAETTKFIYVKMAKL